MGLALSARDVSVRHWAWPAALAVLAIAAQSAGAAILLRYDRAGIAAGEAWRLASGHLAHLGWTHLAMNVAGLLLVWLLVGGAFGPLAWGFVVAFSIAGMDAGFWWFSPGLQWYVGLSGLLHAVLVAGAAAGARPGSAARTESWVILALVAAKLAWEQLAGPLPGSAGMAGGPVVVDAHLYGALAGLGAGILAVTATARRARS
jgi:rhomboid family GlyGly-CTERM serine protease